MKYPSLFFTIAVGSALITFNLPFKDKAKSPFEKDLVLRLLSIDPLKFIGNKNISNPSQKDSVPQIELVVHDDKGTYSWGTQIRYTIKVSDKIDGDSKYGEINSNAVLLEIEYYPVTTEKQTRNNTDISEEASQQNGIILMQRSTCFRCHADKARLAGPSFSEIAKKYNKSDIKALAQSISEGSSGVWGSSVMPANKNLTDKESEQMAAYILEQGEKRNKWILIGLEGTFRIMKKPENSAKGIYVLTASYTSTSQMRGEESIILRIE